MEKDSLYYYGIGMDFLDKADYKLALESFLTSLGMHEHFKTCERIAHVLNVLKRFEEAEKFIEKAFALNPNNDKISVEYAKLLIKHKEREKAKGLLTRILARNSTYGPAVKLLEEVEARDIGGA